MRCRTAIESRVSGALPTGFGPHDVEQLRVALYCAERGTEEVIRQTNDPRWIDTLPDDIAGTITSSLRGPRECPEGRHRRAVIGRGRMRTSMPPRPPSRRDDHGADGEHTHRHRRTASGSTDHSRGRPTGRPVNLAGNSIGDPSPSPAFRPASRRRCAGDPDTPPVTHPCAHDGSCDTGCPRGRAGGPDRQIAGKRAKPPGGVDRLRHHRRIGRGVDPASVDMARRHVVGATAGVAIAASVPDNIVWTVVVVTIGVFFTIVSAACLLSGNGVLDEHRARPALRHRRALPRPDLGQGGRGPHRRVRGGRCRVYRRADPALARLPSGGAGSIWMHSMRRSNLSSRARGISRATAGAALDRAHSALDSMVASALTKTHLFPQPGSPLTEQGVRVDAVHEAFLRLTPLLTDSSRRLHGWTDRQSRDAYPPTAGRRGGRQGCRTRRRSSRQHTRTVGRSPAAASPHPQDTKRVWSRPTPCGSPTTCTPGSLSSPYFSAVTTRACEPQFTSTYPPFGEQHHSVAGDY